LKVVWTEAAIGRLVAVYDYISQDSPFYAQRMVDRLTRRSEQIGNFPMSGRMVPEFGAEDIREVIEKPYRIISRIKSDQIDILTVVHGAQRLPGAL
jgi:plasmid stabilization system protein ParE